MTYEIGDALQWRIPYFVIVGTIGLEPMTSAM